jgi:glycosyltransferase involved in cell wall biosynthesis
MNSFAFNKPVIASDVGGLREVIKDGITGLLVESKNVDSLKEKIEYLIDNPALLEKMGNNIAGMRKDSEISWNNITEKCIEIYNNVIMNFNL